MKHSRVGGWVAGGESLRSPSDADRSPCGLGSARQVGRDPAGPQCSAKPALVTAQPPRAHRWGSHRCRVCSRDERRVRRSVSGGSRLNRDTGRHDGSEVSSEKVPAASASGDSARRPGGDGEWGSGAARRALPVQRAAFHRPAFLKPASVPGPAPRCPSLSPGTAARRGAVGGSPAVLARPGFGCALRPQGLRAAELLPAAAQ